MHPREIRVKIRDLQKDMFTAADRLEYEKAASLRDEIRELERAELRLR